MDTPQDRATADRDDLKIRPLTARSVVLSTLLGLHPPRLPARHLVRVGDPGLRAGYERFEREFAELLAVHVPS